tara:strand:- start:499 stop:2649 length:2151 start_codon:yes stop_codon:yes gene_type:complete
MLGKYLTLGDVHPVLKSTLDRPDVAISSAIRSNLHQFWEIPAVELNNPTAAYYAIEAFDNLSMPLSQLFEQIPQELEFWDLRCSEKLQTALFRDSASITRFSQISQETPAWLQSLRFVAKTTRIELLTLLIIRNCHLGLRALATDIPMEVEDSLRPRERVTDPWFYSSSGPWFNYSNEIFSDDVVISREHRTASGIERRFDTRSDKQKPKSDYEKIMEILEGASGVHAEILSRRIILDKPDTLDAVAANFNLTRERIRQIEVKIRSVLESWISNSQALSDARAEILQRATRIVAIDSYDEESGPLSQKVGDWTAFEIVVGLSKDLQSLDGYLSTRTEIQLKEEVRNFTTNRTSFWGLVQFFEEAERSNLNSEVLFDIAKSRDWIVEIEGQIFSTSSTLRDQAVEILARHGSPLSRADIYKFLPTKGSMNSLRNLLSTDQAFVRTTKSKFGLATWNLEAYSTIPREIAKALENAEEVRLDELTKELSERFEVSPSSVQAYATSWPFEVRNGRVLRSSSNAVSTTKEASEEKDLWSCGSQLIWATQVNNEHRRGSGTAVPRVLCKELNLSNEKSVRLATANGSSLRLGLAGLNWAIGSVRELLEAQAVEVGDWCFFVFDERSFTLIKTSQDAVERFEQLLSKFLPSLDLSDLKQLESALKAMLFLPTNYSMASVFSALKSRSDVELSHFLKGIFPENIAYEMSKNHSSDSRFIIKSVD